MADEPCAIRGCKTPMSTETWHEDERGQHTLMPLSAVLDRLERMEPVYALVANLDRCCHGRHERDVCNNCDRATQGASKNIGNSYADVPCGYDLSGKEITPRELHALTQAVVAAHRGGGEA